MDFRASAYVNYEGPRAIAQGTREGVFVANMGIRKDLMEKKATLSFNIQDVFLSRAYKVSSVPQLILRILAANQSPR